MNEEIAWDIYLQTDVIKGNFLEAYETHMYWAFHYILARRGKECFIHFLTFRDDWEGANSLLERILKAEDFSPKGNRYWYSIRDWQPIGPEVLPPNSLLSSFLNRIHDKTP